MYYICLFFDYGCYFWCTFVLCWVVCIDYSLETIGIVSVIFINVWVHFCCYYCGQCDVGIICFINLCIDLGESIRIVLISNTIITCHSFWYPNSYQPQYPGYEEPSILSWHYYASNCLFDYIVVHIIMLALIHILSNYFCKMCRIYSFCFINDYILRNNIY